MKLYKKIQAVLFDLDGTLIDVDLKKFIPGYLKLLSESIAHLVPPKKVISKLLKASEAVNNNDGTQTNDSLFTQIFFPLEGYTREEIQPYFDKFYETTFSELKRYTKKKEIAHSVVQKVFEKNINAVIATTPLLPLTAIKQRLEWAGVGAFNYALITHIENSRANKPNLLYFEEIINYLGIPAKNCLMVGDEAKDMVAANIGCPTFLVESSNTDMTSDIPDPSFKGNLEDILTII
ncbi:MAG: HAD hydrolase-like protein [Candidatus Lokiarchaeota archaeon]